MNLNINYWVLFAGLVSLIQSISAECPDKILYCFDYAEQRIGGVVVEQCWKWSRLSCQPCNADTDKKFITYQKYVHECQNFYPKSKFVLDKKSTRINKLNKLYSDMNIG